MKSAILSELVKATKVARDGAEKDPEFFARVVRAAVGLEEAEWNAISTPTQKWANACVRAIKAKEALPALPDIGAVAEPASSAKPAKKAAAAKPADDDDDATEAAPEPDEDDAEEADTKPAEDADAPDADDETEDDDAEPATEDTSSDDADDDGAAPEAEDTEDLVERVAKPGKKSAAKPAKVVAKPAAKVVAKPAVKVAAKVVAKVASGGGGKRAGAKTFERLRQTIIRHPKWSKEQVAEHLKSKGETLGTIGTTFGIVHATLRTLATMELYVHPGLPTPKGEKADDDDAGE